MYVFYCGAIKNHNVGCRLILDLFGLRGHPVPDLTNPLDFSTSLFPFRHVVLKLYSFRNTVGNFWLVQLLINTTDFLSCKTIVTGNLKIISSYSE